MNTPYEEIVAHLACRYGVPAEQIDRRVRSRRARTHGLLGPRLAAHSVSASLAIGELEGWLARRVAARATHVSGAREADALRALRAEAAAGRAGTLGYWAAPGEHPAAITARYLRSIELVADAGLPASVSIKVDLLGFDRALLAPVLKAARAKGVRLHFDAQGHETVGRTHALVDEAHGNGADVSATLPSRFMRSLKDAEHFIRLGIPVRVVKGQGGDPEHPKLDPRQAYLELIERLVGRAAFVGVATHDRRVAEAALARLAGTRTPCGLEQMRSLPRIDFVAESLGLPTRVYVAYGHAGLPYAIGELMRRPAIAGWILRDLVLRHRPSPSAPRERP